MRYSRSMFFLLALASVVSLNVISGVVAASENDLNQMPETSPISAPAPTLPHFVLYASPTIRRLPQGDTAELRMRINLWRDFLAKRGTPFKIVTHPEQLQAIAPGVVLVAPYAYALSEKEQKTLGARLASGDSLFATGLEKSWEGGLGEELGCAVFPDMAESRLRRICTELGCTVIPVSTKRPAPPHCADSLGNELRAELDTPPNSAYVQFDLAGLGIQVEHPQDDPLPLEPEALPPGDLAVEQAPLFVSLGFDDNGRSGLPESGTSGGMTWALDYFRDLANPDGSPVRVSFYLSSRYLGTPIYESPALVKRMWRKALEEGHEIGNHTHTHPHGLTLTFAEWSNEIRTATDWFTQPFDPDEAVGAPRQNSGIGIDSAEIVGFRVPYLEYNDAMLRAVQAAGMSYDCSIEEGWHWQQNGTNYHWPYDLKNGSPGNKLFVEWNLREPVGRYPGLWEMPVHPVVVPPDYRAREYGVEPGLRAKMKKHARWFDEQEGKISGFDYNLWFLFKMTKAEFLATLKYTLDLRLKGNRAPFLFGAHTDYYASYPGDAANATYEERQEAIEEFIDYALSKPQVRIAPFRDIVDWMKQPAVLPDSLAKAH